MNDTTQDGFQVLLRSLVLQTWKVEISKLKAMPWILRGAYSLLTVPRKGVSQVRVRPEHLSNSYGISCVSSDAHITICRASTKIVVFEVSRVCGKTLKEALCCRRACL